MLLSPNELSNLIENFDIATNENNDDKPSFNLDNQTIQQVLDGELYKKLKNNHRNNDFDMIEYCKNCDQLYDSPESLVWTNINGKEYGQSKILKDLDYRDYAFISDHII